MIVTAAIVSPLIGPVDQSHVGHEAAPHWFNTIGRSSWATCPITENGLIRIVGNPTYLNSTGSPGTAAQRRLDVATME